jgi:hypothetical protein
MLGESPGLRLHTLIDLLFPFPFLDMSACGMAEEIFHTEW